MSNRIFKPFIVFWLAFFITVGSLSVVISQATATMKVSDHVFVIDTSGSMDGKPIGAGNTIIFPGVKKTIIKYIQSPIMNKAKVMIYTFDRTVRGPYERQLKSDYEKREVINYLEQLQAKGNVTHRYEALDKVFSDLKVNAENAGIQAIYVYSDGLDTSPGEYTLKHILDKFALHRAENNEFLFLHYITLGVELPKDDVDRLNGCPGVVLHSAKKGEVPALFLVELSPLMLDLENIRLNREVEKKIRIRTTADTSNRIKIQTIFDDLSKIGVLVENKPEVVALTNSKITVTFTVDNLGEKTPPGPHSGYLVFTPPDTNTVIMPSKLPLKLNFRHKCEIMLKAPPGENLAPNLGEFDPWHGLAEKNHIFSKTFKLYPNTSATNYGDSIEVSAVLEEGPQQLPIKLFTGKGLIKGKSIKITPADQEFSLQINYKEAKKGKYKGHISFRPTMSEIKGENIIALGKAPMEYKWPFNFKVPKKPIPVWRKVLWVIGVIIIILIVVCKLMTPKFSRSLYIDDPGFQLSAYNPRFCLKRWKTLGNGKDADIKHPSLPSRIVMKISPLNDRAVHAVALEKLKLGKAIIVKNQKFTWYVGKKLSTLDDNSLEIELSSLEQ